MSRLLSDRPFPRWPKIAIRGIFGVHTKWRIFRVPYPGLPKDVWNCTRPDVDVEMPKELYDRLHVPKMACKPQNYSKHQSGIFKAAFEDDIETVTEFIEKETHLSKSPPISSFTEFTLALDIRNWRGDTPLTCAIRGRADNTIDWLLENKASPEFGGWLYEPPIVAATAINNESAVETLLRKEIGTGSYLCKLLLPLISSKP